MSRAKQSMKDAVREWAKTANRADINTMCEILATALLCRTFGLEEEPPAEPKRGRPPGSRNRPKEQPATGRVIVAGDSERATESVAD